MMFVHYQSFNDPLPWKPTDGLQACDSAFQSTGSYDHASTQSWNSHIINAILQNLIGETSSSGQQPSYKFAVNSTIIQHAFETREEEGGAAGKRGMHSASGAYWNSESDGMWNFKYEKSESKGFDVVISVIWISLF